MNKSDFVIVHEGKYVGLKNKSGEVVLPCEYDKIPVYDDDGYIRFIKDGIYGTIDLKGNICIPLTEKLSHLGVFYKGTARARINGNWGLVDVHGTHVTGFIYKSIDAHGKDGYHAVTLKGRQVLLGEDGSFKVPAEVARLFDTSYYLLKLSPWLGDWQNPLNFYYRDTDADIDVKKLYKPGHFIRTDCDMEVTKKLLRPVHKIRFLIAARRFVPAFRENMVPALTHFLVVDVQFCGGVTQIVLLHFPHGAMLLAKHFKIKASMFKPKDADGIDLKKAAKYDLLQKMCECVHGYSLDAAWCKAMYQPVGCNARLQLNELIMEHYPYSDFYGNPEIMALRSLQDCDEEWKDESFI